MNAGVEAFAAQTLKFAMYRLNPTLQLLGRYFTIAPLPLNSANDRNEIVPEEKHQG